MPSDPSTSGTSSQANIFPKKGNRSEITTLVTFDKNKKDPFRWISTKQTGDEVVSIIDASYYKA
ncbi:hypothetical protein E2C01_081676 [Portunus trituberculatus]|uniref:Uncharacterized protein n=1 Tax=Portunus trituberculatus TaxID=210409 RepID=A0A5B7IQE2_PORTR|nr:hypothetical protein [Portunus trituberculatus]